MSTIDPALLARVRGGLQSPAGDPLGTTPTPARRINQDQWVPNPMDPIKELPPGKMLPDPGENWGSNGGQTGGLGF